MKKVILSGFLLGFTLPSIAMSKSPSLFVHYHSIPKVGVCFKETRVIDSVEPVGNGADIHLTTYSVESELIDCRHTEYEKVAINESDFPILVKGAGKVTEYVYQATSEISKEKGYAISFKKREMFSGHGIVFDPSTGKCSDEVVQLMQIKRIPFGNGFIEQPQVSTKAEITSCQF